MATIYDSTGKEIVKSLKDITNAISGSIASVEDEADDLPAENPDKVIRDSTGQEIVNSLKDITNALSDKYLFDDIPGTTQTVTFNANDQPASVVHTSGNDTVRSDVFTWGDGTVTEVRTLADGRHVTYATNLTTLVTTISEVEEAI